MIDKNADIYNKLKSGKVYEAEVVVTSPLIESTIGESKEVIYFLDESRNMTKEELENNILKITRRTPGGSFETILRVNSLKEICLSEEILKRMTDITVF